MMKKLLFMAFVAIAVSACAKDEPQGPTPMVIGSKVINFEAAELGEAGFIWGKSQATEQTEISYDGTEMKSNLYHGAIYTENTTQVVTFYSDHGHTFDTWNGFIISNHKDRTNTEYTNDKSVYADGGAAESKQFAVGYYSTYTIPLNRGIPAIKSKAVLLPCTIDIAHTTYTYSYFQKSAVKANFDLVIKGYMGNVQLGTNTVTIPMIVDNVIQEGWKTVDISAIGKASILEFSVVCSDINAPTYFCIDNLTYEQI